MKTSITAAVLIALFFMTTGGSTAMARDYAADPVAQSLKDREGREWDKIKKAHQNDWAVRDINELEDLAEKEEYAPKAVLTILMMACHGSEAAEKYILDYAEGMDTPAGVLAILGSVFLDHEKVIPRLLYRLGRRSRNADFFRGAAGTALANLTGISMEPDQKRWREWWKENKDTFRPDNKLNMALYRYEMENGPLTTRWIFQDAGRDDYFMGLLTEFNDKVRKFTGERWPFSKALEAMRGGRFEEAQNIAQAALRDHPADGYALYIAGCMALQTGDVEKAQKHFDALVALNGQTGSAKLLAAYCKELISAKKKNDLDVLLTLFRKLPRSVTRMEWDVPTTYIFDNVFSLSQERIERFAKENVARPELLSGAVMMLKDPKPALELVDRGIKNNPNNAPLRMLRLQFLMKTTIKEDCEQAIQEIKALSLLDSDNGVFDCFALVMAKPDELESIDMSGRGSPLTQAELDALTAASRRRRFSFMTKYKVAALLAALRKMDSPVPLTMAAQARRESILSDPYWVFRILSTRAAQNIAAAVAEGDMKKAKQVYAVLERLANRTASENRSYRSANVAISIMGLAEKGMAEGYRQRGEKEKEKEVWARHEKRKRDSGISTVDLDDFRYIRTIPVPRIAELLSAAMLSDETGLYRKYPPVYEDAKDENGGE